MMLQLFFVVGTKIFLDPWSIIQCTGQEHNSPVPKLGMQLSLTAVIIWWHHQQCHHLGR